MTPCALFHGIGPVPLQGRRDSHGLHAGQAVCLLPGERQLQRHLTLRFEPLPLCRTPRQGEGKHGSLDEEARLAKAQQHKPKETQQEVEKYVWDNSQDPPRVTM